MKNRFWNRITNRSFGMDFNTYPDANDTFYNSNPRGSGVEVLTVFYDDMIRPLFVIVEMYDHKRYGKNKRMYLSQFDERERKIISHYYNKLYGWYLRTGIPRSGVAMKMDTYATLVKAANFFAAIT